MVALPTCNSELRKRGNDIVIEVCGVPAPTAAAYVHQHR